MEFSLKIQHLGKNEEQPENGLFLTHEFGTPEEQILAKRGRLFIATGLEARPGFDLSSATSLFLETIQENYFRITEDTPLSSIEKSLNRAYQTLLSFRSENEESSLGAVSSKLKFSFCTALIWNKVLYASYLGHPAVFLIRGAGVRNLGMDHPSSEIWTNSSILDDEDVVIIGTEDFAKTYPAAEITGSFGSISETIKKQPEYKKLKAIFIKTSLKSTVSSESLLDRITNAKIRNSITNTLRKMQDRITKGQALSDKFKFYQNKKAAPISSIGSGSSPKHSVKPGVSAESVSKRISMVNRRKRGARQIMVGLTMIAAAGYIGYKLTNNNTDKNSQESQLSLNLEDEGDRIYSEIKGIQSRNPNYPLAADISSIAEKFQPAGLAAFKEDIVILLNSADNSLIQADLKTQKIEKIGEGFDKAILVRCSEDRNLCSIYGGHNLYVVDPEIPDKIDQYSTNLDGVVDIYPYGYAVYLLTSNGIYKLANGATAPEKWSDDSEIFFNASSFAVDGSVYVSANGKIYKYYNKKLIADFSVDTGHLYDPGKIVVQGKTLYVMNLQSRSITLFDKQTGDFIKEIKIEGYTTETGPGLFTVTRSARPRIVFLEGSYLYSIDLE